MHSHLFDRYQAKNSTLHRLSPVVKVVATVLFIFSNALLPDGAWLTFGLSWLLILGLNLAAQLGWGFTLKRSFIALPFALAAITAIFALPGETIATWHFLGTELVATDTGLTRFLSIVIRSWLSVQVAILLVSVTLFPDLIHALEHLRLPKMLITVIAFLYRYIFVLSDEVLRLLRAREARSASLPPRSKDFSPYSTQNLTTEVVTTRSGGTLLWRAKTAGHMVGQLFLRSYERSERIYNAMLSRGYQGHLRTLNPHHTTTNDKILLVIILLFFALLQLFAHAIG